MNKEVNSVLEPSESVSWSGKIDRRAINLYHGIGLFVLVIIVMALYAFSGDGFTVDVSGEEKIISLGLVVPLVLLFGLLLIGYSYWNSFITEYHITNKRILIKSGVIGTDFHSIYYEEIRNSYVSVGPVDKILGIGSIKIDNGQIETTGGGDHSSPQIRTKLIPLKHIMTPYDAFKIVQSHVTTRRESLYSGRADRETLAATKEDDTPSATPQS